MTRRVRTSPGAAHDLGYHLAWYPKGRRPVLGGRVKTRLEESIRAKAGEHGRWIVALGVMAGQVHMFVKPHPRHSPSSVTDPFMGFTSPHPRAGSAHRRLRLPTLWSRSFLVATAGVVSAQKVRRSFEARDERGPKGGGRA
ncbi:IS200/IS605 family transposase [Streptosporangium sp. NPDC002721]|uniref:IS200/IS605 family transposase n=1 Tax=Streptosporangium sp. NPDC002721 TaxID=3366188 RepID=UPI0036B6CA52